jgi:RES domain-containing protein
MAASAFRPTSISSRSLLLLVPSLVARIESNFLINPDHPEVGHFFETRVYPI